jgi:hypothetical protein
VKDGELACYGALADLPPAARTLLDAAGRETLFASRPWFESLIGAGLQIGSAPALFVLPDPAGVPLALLPCQRFTGPEADRGPGLPRVASLTSFYSCDYRPGLRPDAEIPEAAFALGRGVARALAGEAVVRFDSLDPGQPWLEPFLDGLSRPGRALLRYDHFGRWWEPLDGRNFDAYFGAREGALREIVRRKGNRLAKEGATLAIVARDDLARGIADYETVYARSWKEHEPFPDFQPLLMRKLADAGWLRLALCRLGDRPVAAQLWVVVDGRATVLKLAHDQEFDRYSPGTVLTAFAIRTLMAEDRITTLDFGRGDDAYKRAWTTRRTAHVGILWTSLARRPLLAARHLAGLIMRRNRS